MRRLLAVTVLLALVACVGTAVAARGDPQKKLTSADNARARAMLLKKSDLPSGFYGARVPPREIDAYCKAVDVSDLTVTGEAESPNFSRGIASVTSTAQVYASAADASTSWRRGTSAAGERCTRAFLRREFAKEGIRLESYERITFPNVAARSAAYRVGLSAESKGLAVRIVMDVIALTHSRAHAAVLFTGASPVPRAEQLPLARLVAQRMAKAMRGA